MNTETLLEILNWQLFDFNRLLPDTWCKQYKTSKRRHWHQLISNWKKDSIYKITSLYTQMLFYTELLGLVLSSSLLLYWQRFDCDTLRPSTVICYSCKLKPLFNQPIYLSLPPTRQDYSRLMTWRSIKVGIREGESQARVEARALLDYGAALPTEGGPAETGGLTALSMPLLDCARISNIMETIYPYSIDQV